MSEVKRFVKVIVSHEADGSRIPEKIIFDDAEYCIDTVKHEMRLGDLRKGGRGTRYTIMIKGQETKLYEEDGRFYVEAKVKDGA